MEQAVKPRVRVDHVPAEHYLSREIVQLEKRLLWPRVWQLACTVDHVANPGDWHEYRVGHLSVLIVRGDDGVLRAFQNVCLHRGSELCSGSGSDRRAAATASATKRSMPAGVKSEV